MKMLITCSNRMLCDKQNSIYRQGESNFLAECIRGYERSVAVRIKKFDDTHLFSQSGIRSRVSNLLS